MLNNRFLRLHGSDKHDNDKGFTLVELLVVVIILALLASISIMIFMGQRVKANNARLLADVSAAGAVANQAKPLGGSLVVTPTTVSTDMNIGSAKTSAGTFSNPVPLDSQGNYCIELTNADGQSANYTSLKGARLGTCANPVDPDPAASSSPSGSASPSPSASVSPSPSAAPHIPSIVTIAGTGTAGSTNGVGTTSMVSFPQGVAVASNGTIYFTDENGAGGSQVRKLTTDGTLSTVVGTTAVTGWHAAGAICQNTGVAAGVAYDFACVLNLADAVLYRPRGITIGIDGALYISLAGTGGAASAAADQTCNAGSCIIRRIDLTAGTISGYVGRGARARVTSTSPFVVASQVAKTSSNATISKAQGVGFAPNGDFYFTSSDDGCLFRRDHTDTMVSQVWCEPFGANGTGQVNMGYLDFDTAGNVYVATDRGILKVAAGTNTATKWTNSNFLIPSCSTYCVSGMAVSSNGSKLWFTMYSGTTAEIMEMTINQSDFAASTATPLFSNGKGFADGDYSTAKIAASSSDLAYDPTTGDLIVTDMSNQRIRRIDL